MEHLWDVSISEATQIQKALRSCLSLEPLAHSPRTIAGADVSFNRFSPVFYAGIVVLSYPDLVEIEHAVHRMEVHFPYVPGYLSFREVPALVETFQKLQQTPDLIMMDGQGIAHPRRLGVASHLSLAVGVPTIGCAKTRLYGEGILPGAEPGSTAPLSDPRAGDEVIGMYLRSKTRAKPLIISPGNGITLAESVDITQMCLRGYRIPEPTRRAHALVNAFRRGEIEA